MAKKKPAPKPKPKRTAKAKPRPAPARRRRSGRPAAAAATPPNVAPPAPEPTSAKADATAGPGRPRKEVDSVEVARLIAEAKTVESVAQALGCSKRTLEIQYRQAVEAGRERRNSSLQEAQYAAAIAGSVPMLIWLGKQWLGQRDKQEIKTDDAEGFRFAGKTREEINREIMQRLTERVANPPGNTP